MSNDNKEAKKEELLEQQEALKLTEEELEQVTGGQSLTQPLSISGRLGYVEVKKLTSAFENCSFLTKK